jgi:predicted nucleotide-binding protein
MEETRLRLLVSNDQADAVLADMLERGDRLREVGEAVMSESEADAWHDSFDRWVKLTAEGLRSIFTGDGAAEEFRASARIGSFSLNDEWPDWHRRWMKVQSRAANNLVSLRERLTFAIGEKSDPPGPTPATGAGKNVFVVHGKDDATKQTVARFLEKVVEPGVIVLAEQPDQGRTIIEKFEDYAAEVGYAVVLLTGDDEGRELGTEDALRPRARQNVILELGFFVGTLGRGHVALLYEDGVELPSDIAGVLYLRLDGDGAWKRRLASEMLEADIPLDAEAVLRA